ncbi:hypothetical protein PPYR_01007 [Photinus pyralis]|uniref:5'-deoxynucleotidase HDDC2 n=1 Tax=Photinus pyralis TaxID=7054 RepID=A0A1Y1L3S7_PHOPY|nr:HD domain-containing protein 2 [Photinus pyralis]KAB0804037.1 hypothetical protein PPYR_01007 [Photinus pyralis]
MESLNVNDVLQFLKIAHNLKHSARKGWEYRGIKNPESIASHMYNMALMTFLLGDNSTVDRLLCLQLAIVHDLAESIVGDITPQDNISADVKHKMEDEAMKELTSYLGGGVGNKIYELYKEYELKESAEAKFVKDLDLFDMIFTASEYEIKENTIGRLQEFFDSTRGRINNPFIKQLATTLEDKRALNRE